MKNLTREQVLKEEIFTQKNILRDLQYSGEQWAFAIPDQQRRVKAAEAKLNRFYEIKKELNTNK